VKKYLLLVEDEKLWERFKSVIKDDINTELIALVREKTEKTKEEGKKNG
jgi:hypothetical protein